MATSPLSTVPAAANAPATLTETDPSCLAFRAYVDARAAWDACGGNDGEELHDAMRAATLEADSVLLDLRPFSDRGIAAQLRRHFETIADNEQWAIRLAAGQPTADDLATLANAYGEVQGFWAIIETLEQRNWG